MDQSVARDLEISLIVWLIVHHSVDYLNWGYQYEYIYTWTRNELFFLPNFFVY